METITIKGTVYNVLHSDTPEQTAAAGYEATAEFMRRDGRTRHLMVQRPNGKKQYFVVEWPMLNGQFQYRLVAGAL